MSLYDCFIFSTELDLLGFRLDLLHHVVDYFVIVEATHTYSGLPKDLVFRDNRQRFSNYLDKIIHVVVDDLPTGDTDRWSREIYQRNAIRRGLTEAAQDDLILISDVDEIPNPEVIVQLGNQPFATASLELRACYFRGNWEAPTPWPLTRVARFSALQSPQELRDSQPLFRVPNAGAHLSYLMTNSEIVRKFSSFSHSELDNRRTRHMPYLHLMQEAAVFAPSGTLLVNRNREALNAVQTALLKRSPRSFSFHRFPPLIVRQLFRKYSILRMHPRFPEKLVLAIDRILCRGIGIAMWLSSR